ncbi:hypothetical protein ACFL18_01040 [Patescibacteria group bacterium]
MNYSLGVISNWQEAIYLAGANILSQFFGFLPNLFGALLIFLFGLLLAKWSKKVVVKVFGTIKLDTLVKKLGFGSFLSKADVKVKTEVLFGEIVRWLFIAVFFVAAVNILGLTTISQVLNSILSYIPSIVSAVIVLTVGVLLAGFIESFVKGAVNQLEPKTSRLLSKIASYLVVTVSVLAAINELGIAQSLINTLFTGVVATLTLGLGLGLGLGSKDLISKALMDWYTSNKKTTKK